eukprot:364283-Chlamydomonas_euryale.AAC.32
MSEAERCVARPTVYWTCQRAAKMAGRGRCGLLVGSSVRRSWGSLGARLKFCLCRSDTYWSNQTRSP